MGTAATLASAPQGSPPPHTSSLHFSDRDKKDGGGGQVHIRVCIFSMKEEKECSPIFRLFSVCDPTKEARFIG